MQAYTTTLHPFGIVRKDSFPINKPPFSDGGKATKITFALFALPYLFALSQTLTSFQVSSCYSKDIFLLPRPPPLYLIDVAKLLTFFVLFKTFD